MLTPEALNNLREAGRRMQAATEAHRAFLEQPNRQYSPDERAESKRLQDAVRQRIDEYRQAFEKCKD
jgi:hypothetical protein